LIDLNCLKPTQTVTLLHQLRRFSLRELQTHLSLRWPEEMPRLAHLVALAHAAPDHPVDLFSVAGSAAGIPTAEPCGGSPADLVCSADLSAVASPASVGRGIAPPEQMRLLAPLSDSHVSTLQFPTRVFARCVCPSAGAHGSRRSVAIEFRPAPPPRAPERGAPGPAERQPTPGGMLTPTLCPGCRDPRSPAQGLGSWKMVADVPPAALLVTRRHDRVTAGTRERAQAPLLRANSNAGKNHTPPDNHSRRAQDP